MGRREFAGDSSEAFDLDPGLLLLRGLALRPRLEQRRMGAYHVSVTLEDGSGVYTIATSPDPLPPFSADMPVSREIPRVFGFPHESCSFRWEDYGGIPDSLVAPAVDDTLPAPCD